MGLMELAEHPDRATHRSVSSRLLVFPIMRAAAGSAQRRRITLDEKTGQERQGLNRRTFLRRAALTGAAAAWATPVIQTVTVGPAFAASGSAFTCTHSFGPYRNDGQIVETGGCMQACKNGTAVLTAALDAVSDPCAIVCNAACPNNCGTDERQCINGDFCNASNWNYFQQGRCKRATFLGSTTVSGNFNGTCGTGAIPTTASQNCNT
jgi:hypothetical protein